MKNDFSPIKPKKLNQFKPKSQNESCLSKVISCSNTKNAHGNSINVNVNGKALNLLSPSPNGNTHTNANNHNDNNSNYSKKRHMKKKSFSFFTSSSKKTQHNKKAITLSSNQSLLGSNKKTKDLSQIHHTDDQDNQHPKSDLNASMFLNTSIIKYQEEALELQLSNSRMKNEICILNEKVKSLQQIISMITVDNDLLKTKYTTLLSDYKGDLSQLKEANQRYKSSIDKTGIIIKSLIGIVIEVIEMFFNRGINLNANTTTANNNTNTNNPSANANANVSAIRNSYQADYSLDVYDSFNGDEEKRLCLIDQIQGVIIAKISRITFMFDINLDKEIERVQNWNNGVYMSFRKLSRINDEISNSISKIVNSNSTSNEFDLSVSGQFYNLSPRFNSFDNEGNKGDKGKKGCVTENILNELNNCSFRDFNSNSTNNNKEEVKCVGVNGSGSNNGNGNNGFIKILDCSFGEGDKEKERGKGEEGNENSNYIGSIKHNNTIDMKKAFDKDKDKDKGCITNGLNNNNQNTNVNAKANANGDNGDYINFTLEDVVNEDNTTSNTHPMAIENALEHTH